MENYRRSGYGALAQTCLLLGLPTPAEVNETLNEKLSIQAGVYPSTNERVAMRYMTIGIGGARAASGVQSLTLFEPIMHEARHGGHYHQIPFVLRPVEEDLTDIERARYALRRVEEHDGIEYAAYYLRRMDLTNVVPKLTLRTVTGGTTAIEDFVATSADLNPTPPALNNNGNNVVTGQYLAATAAIPVELDEFDATEILSACVILYGSEKYAMISEIGLCTGVDRPVTVLNTATGTNISYTEVIQAQTAIHMATMQTMWTARQGFRIMYDVGGTEPMQTLATP